MQVALHCEGAAALVRRLHHPYLVHGRGRGPPCMAHLPLAACRVKNRHGHADALWDVVQRDGHSWSTGKRGNSWLVENCHAGAAGGAARA